MSREEIEKLLGGYATDTLGEAQKRALFEAALDDRELFDRLAKEQALREVLHDPAARQQLIEALGPAREPFGAGVWRWLRRPAVLAMAGGLATLLIVAGLVLRPRPLPRPEAMMADAITARQSAPGPARAIGAQPRLAAGKLHQRAVPEKTAAQAQEPVQLPAPPALSAQDEGLAPANLPTTPAPPPAQAAPPLPGPATGGAIGGVAGRSFAPAQSTVNRFGQRSALPSPSPIRVKAAKAPGPTVTYSLLLKGADGAYSPAPTDAAFHVGDSVRIQVEANDAGYIYLFRKDATGAWSGVASLPAEKGQRYAVPTDGGLESGTPAQLELMLVFSRREQESLQAGDVDTLSNAAGQAVYRIVLEFR